MLKSRQVDKQRASPERAVQEAAHLFKAMCKLPITHTDINTQLTALTLPEDYQNWRASHPDQEEGARIVSSSEVLEGARVRARVESMPIPEILVGNHQPATRHIPRKVT